MSTYEVVNEIIVPIIHASAGVSLALIVVSFIASRAIRPNDPDFKKSTYYWAEIPYTIFIVLISLFPLLGMLGTVSALLTLDISGDTELLKINFFQALNTTFWGIVYAVAFKLLNAFVQPTIEAHIELGKKLLGLSVTDPIFSSSKRDRRRLKKQEKDDE